MGNALGDAGKELYLFGQYGNERWSLDQPPDRLARVRRAGWRRTSARCPSLLRRLDAADAFVEEKGLAVAVHTRRLPDPAGAFDRLLPELEKLATDPGSWSSPAVR